MQAVPVQAASFSTQALPNGQGAPPSASQRWAQTLPTMQTSPWGQPLVGVHGLPEQPRPNDDDNSTIAVRRFFTPRSYLQSRMDRCALSHDSDF